MGFFDWLRSIFTPDTYPEKKRREKDEEDEEIEELVALEIL
ncbi:MAG: hypothetical protein A4E40_00945 [Methanoregulaceae archaeon PtaU1.Bin059]|nr:MAG: hypothetical protein A4E39_01571 [Methanoregulaceae archaeon PtaB.Bin152]OPY39950.1 MAG: hypothetical protein A4E40_00945 [Methanoregulaceae archaeon PtaU1.Bin059]